MKPPNENSGTVLLITSDGIGQGDRDLRQKLAHIYLTMLVENERWPAAICFYGEGVKLVITGSPELDLLKTLENQGVLLISCVTCLRHYALEERVAVSVVGGMHDILAAQWRATKVITL